MRASASTLTAALISAVAILSLVSAFAKLSTESYVELRRLYDEAVRLSSTAVWSEIRDGSVVLRSSSPVRILGIFSIGDEGVVKVLGETSLNGALELGALSGKLLVVLEGGRYLLVDPANDTDGSSPEVLEHLGYKLAVALVHNVWSYLAHGVVHSRYSTAQPPTEVDTGYRRLLDGSVTFYYTGLTYRFPSGNYWSTQDGRVVVRAGAAIVATGATTNPPALTQVLRVVRASGSKLKLSIFAEVKVSGSSTSSVYPTISVVYYELPPHTDLSLPAAYFQPPAAGHYPPIRWGVLDRRSGVTDYSFSQIVEIPATSGNYIVVGVEVLTLGSEAVVVAKVEVSVVTY